MKLRHCIAGLAGLMVPSAAMADDKDKHSQPVAEHHNLNALVGTWDVSGQCWSETGQAETVSGTVKSEWVLGKRFIRCQINGMREQQPMEGISLCGFDTLKNKYVCSYASNECTSIKLDEGAYDPSSKTFTFTGHFPGEGGQNVATRREIKIVSNDEHTMTFYLTENGAEKKLNELTFKRSTKSAQVQPETP